MAGVVYENSNGILSFQKTLREDVLRCLYGSQSESASKLIDFGISLAHAVIQSEGFGSETREISGIHLGPLRETAALTDYQLLRTAILMHSSLSMINDQDADEEEDPSKNASEEGNRQFGTKVRELISQKHPELTAYFNQSIKLNGLMMRFGYLSKKAAVHFNVITPQRLSAGVGTARSKLWELSLAAETQGSKVALINAFSSESDPTLTDNQLQRLQTSKYALQQEASAKNIKLFATESVQSASEQLLEMVA